MKFCLQKSLVYFIVLMQTITLINSISLANLKKINSKSDKIKIKEDIIFIRNSTEFQSEVLDYKSIVMVNFYNPDEKISKDISEILEKEYKKHSGFKLVYVDVMKNPELAKEYKIDSVPVLTLFKNGKRLDQGNKLTVADEKQIETIIDTAFIQYD